MRYESEHGKPQQQEDYCREHTVLRFDISVFVRSRGPTLPAYCVLTPSRASFTSPDCGPLGLSLRAS